MRDVLGLTPEQVEEIERKQREAFAAIRESERAAATLPPTLIGETPKEDE